MIKKAVILIILLTTAGCTGQDISKEQAEEIAKDTFLKNNPNLQPTSTVAENFGTNWKVKIDSKIGTASYYVNKDDGSIMITQEYAVEIAKRDPKVKDLYNDPNTYSTFEISDSKITLRIIVNNIDVMKVVIDSKNENILNVEEKSFSVDI